VLPAALVGRIRGSAIRTGDDLDWLNPVLACAGLTGMIVAEADADSDRWRPTPDIVN